MRKGLLAVTAVVLVGGGYLAAQAYSSERFDDELTQGLNNLEENEDLTVERQDIKKGWFTSSGEIILTAKRDERFSVSFPYTANHGLTSTRLSGEMEVVADDQALFADKLEVAPPRWHAEIETLSGDFTGRLDLSAMDIQDADNQLTSEGGFFTIKGQPDDARLDGEIAPWEFRNEEGSLEVGRLTLTSRYQQDEAGQQRDQQASISLDSLVVARDYNPTVELADMGYEGNLSLGADELQLGGTLKLGEARVDDEPLLSGELAFSLSQINADAVRTLETAIDEATSGGTPIEELNDEELAALIERLEPQVLALFADSPKLTLEHLAVKSDLLSMDTDLSGELTFDGDGVENLSLDDLDKPKQRLRWMRRLDGEFDWQGVPPMALMQLGLPMTTERLEILIENGRPSVNGQPLPPLL
jgi:uncharacterized protein YdgA (DUF945 family)